MKEHGNASISSFNIFQRYCTQLTLSRYQYRWCHWNSVNSIDCKQDIVYVWPKSKCDCVQIVCTKVRDGNNRIVRLKEGEPQGRHVVIVDDLVQSGGTLIECQVWNYYIHTNVFTGLLRYLWDRSFSLEHNQGCIQSDCSQENTLSCYLFVQVVSFMTGFWNLHSALLPWLKYVEKCCWLWMDFSEAFSSKWCIQSKCLCNTWGLPQEIMGAFWAW